jgi:hypothetical protein
MGTTYRFIIETPAERKLHFFRLLNDILSLKYKICTFYNYVCIRAKALSFNRWTWSGRANFFLTSLPQESGSRLRTPPLEAAPLIKNFVVSFLLAAFALTFVLSIPTLFLVGQTAACADPWRYPNINKEVCRCACWDGKSKVCLSIFNHTRQFLRVRPLSRILSLTSCFVLRAALPDFRAPAESIDISSLIRRELHYTFLFSSPSSSSSVGPFSPNFSLSSSLDGEISRFYLSFR